MSTVTDSPIFSPASGGRRNTIPERTDRHRVGSMTLTMKYTGTLCSTKPKFTNGILSATIKVDIEHIYIIKHYNSPYNISVQKLAA